MRKRRQPARARASRIASRKTGFAAESRSNRALAIYTATLVALTVIAYLPAIAGQFVWDDDDYVLNNLTLRSLAGLGAIWLDPSATPQYYPLVHTSFWIEYRLWGLSPAGYHVTNILLHAAGACVLWRVLHLLELRGAWLVAMIFAIHPVHVESVAWITERKNVLSGVLYLAAMLTYLPLAIDMRDEASAPRRRRYMLAYVFFLLALLSKSVTATLPAALLLLIAWKRGRVRRADIWPLVPFFFTGVIAGLTTIWLERHYVGAEGVDWQLSFLERCVIAGRALWFYAQKIVWPMDLMFIYPRWRIDASDPGQLVFPVAVVGVLLALWLTRHRIGSGPLTAVLLFAGTLFPALGFFDVFPMRYSFVADHFQYLASIALITLGVGVIARLVEERAPGRAGAARAAAMVIVVVLATLTWRQCHVYADHETLWRDTVRQDPASWMGHTSLGALLGQRGVLTEAETHYREAVRLNPNFAIAHVNLGGLLANQGRFTEAIPHMREAVRLEPRSLTNHVSLGRALMYSGHTDEAIVWFRRAVAGWPEDADARALLEAALAAQSSTPHMRP